LAFDGVDSALETWWALSSIFSGGILGLFLLGLVSHGTKSPQAAIGVLVGVLVIGWMSLSAILFRQTSWSSFQNPLHTNMVIVMGTLSIFLVGFLLSFWVGRKE
jgi:SSS family solute:Na+ symporter